MTCEHCKNQGWPKNACLNYIKEHGGLFKLVTKENFDIYARDNVFFDGPHIDSFGDDYGEPYNPWRQAFGKLNTGEIVYCEAHHATEESIPKELFDIDRNIKDKEAK